MDKIAVIGELTSRIPVSTQQVGLAARPYS